jgi:hypothetical protein
MLIETLDVLYSGELCIIIFCYSFHRFLHPSFPSFDTCPWTYLWMVFPFLFNCVHCGSIYSVYSTGNSRKYRITACVHVNCVPVNGSWCMNNSRTFFPITTFSMLLDFLQGVTGVYIYRGIRRHTSLVDATTSTDWGRLAAPQHGYGSIIWGFPAILKLIKSIFEAHLDSHVCCSIREIPFVAPGPVRFPR